MNKKENIHQTEEIQNVIAEANKELDRFRKLSSEQRSDLVQEIEKNRQAMYVCFNSEANNISDEILRRPFEMIRE